MADVYVALRRRIEAAPAHAPSMLDIWTSLLERLDVSELRPRLAPDIEIKRFSLRWGNDYAMIANPRELVHYRLEPAEAALLPLMDGTRTVREILVERLRESGDIELSSLVDVVEQLREGGFLDTPYVDVGAALDRALDPLPWWRRKLRRFVTTLSIDWSGAHRFVAWAYRSGLRWFFVPWVSGAMGVVAVVGLVAFLAVPGHRRFDLSGGGAAAASFLLLALNYLLTFVHELAHAAGLVHYGRRVKAAGFMIYFGSPAFFIESSDGLMLERRQRIVQSFAGPYSELVLAGAAALWAWGFPDSTLSPLLYKWALLNYLVIFLNLVPLLELDGYWILSDLIQVPDLRPRSLRFIRYDLWVKLRGRQRLTKREVGLAFYGLLGIGFTILAVLAAAVFWRAVFGDLVRELWEGGLLTRLLLLALALFLAGPVLRGAAALLRAVAATVRAAVRSARFRVQTRWRVEAAQLIDALPIFDDLPEDLLSDLAGRVQLRAFHAGKAVFRQGDAPTAFYVIRSGTFHVIEEDSDTGEERVIRTLGRGAFFGELALLERTPRAATVRAVEGGEVFEVDRSTFDRLLADVARVPGAAPTLQAVIELRRLPAFASLGGEDVTEILAHGGWVNVPPGEVIVRQGEAGDAFYAIASGRAGVLIDGRTVNELGPGDHFGELALLSDAPRSATVVARTPLRLFRLDPVGFGSVVASAFQRGSLRTAVPIDRAWKH